MFPARSFHDNNNMKRILFLSTFILATAANAAVFWSPTLALFPAAGPVVLGPMVAPPLVSPVVDDLGNFAATLTSTVHSGGSNPLGGLTFTYTLSNDVLPPTAGDDIYAFSVLWDPAYRPPSIDVDSIPAAGAVTPFSFAYGPNGIVFSFNFVSLPVGSSTDTVVIGTAAPRWIAGNSGIINGTTEDARALVPVPETSTFAGLFALGLAGFAAWRRFRC
jgi:hypothetical protein